MSIELAPIRYAGRADGVRQRLPDGVTALLVTELVNIRWLTGFTGSSATAAVLPDRLLLVTDGRYRERAEAELADAGVDAELLVGFTAAEQHELLVAAMAGIDRIGAEAHALTHARWQALAADLPLVAVSGAVEEGRRVKDDGELARIELACRCADAALAEVAPMLADGMTETDVRTELEYRMRRHGADGPSYDTIVASGPDHAARPHHAASRRTIVEGDTVIIDVGALVDGYHSDMTRSFVIGDPTPEQQELYDLVLATQLAGMAAVAAGVPAREIDATCRRTVTEAGFGDWYLHGTGHGVGLQIHEDPFETPTSTATLLAGDVVTVEPGLYRVGLGGFRVEDLVEVTVSGARALTTSPKDTPCLPSPPTT